jgi:hypothetical protein
VAASSEPAVDALDRVWTSRAGGGISKLESAPTASPSSFQMTVICFISIPQMVQATHIH